MFIGGEQGPFAKTFSGMIHKFFVAFIPIFVAIDPIGLVAMFMGLAGNASREHRQREGFIGIFTALCVSVGFVFLGKIIFTALGITVADFQVAGGLILLGLAGRELLNISPADREATNDFGVVPLGMPLIAGPALLTALLILVDTVGLIFTLFSMVVNLALVAVAFWNADLVARWMGRQGLRGVSKIVALLLAAIAVSLIRRGWQGV
ncbi:MAG: MarC family protein [Verrucomicrobia bacterium]|nr:MAG: MarC family protein [Verrucomicrobiota bacterium]PYK43725.1 MAG: MarC family protein [Verrucomicrobiota bacterium]